MNQRPPQLDPDRAARLAWASELLEVPAKATAAEVRQTFLRSLASDDFLPSAERHEAFRIWQQEQALAPIRALANVDQDPLLAQTAPAMPEACWQAQEELLLLEVESFAREMFQMPPSERRERWRELEGRTRTWARPQGRLEGLVNGLAVDLATLAPDGPAIREVAERLCEMFVLRPLPRAALREKLLAEWAVHSTKWAVAARVISNRYPELMALDATLVNFLARPGKEKQLAPTPFAMAPALEHDYEPRPQRNRPSDSGLNPWTARAAIFFVIVAVRIIATIGCEGLKPNWQTNPTYLPSTRIYEPGNHDTDVKKGMDVMRRLREKYPDVRESVSPHEEVSSPEPARPETAPQLEPGAGGGPAKPL